MVHQHFMLIPVMTVAENIVLADEPHKGLLMDRAAARERVRELSDRYGLAVDPDARVEDITVGKQQRVEILRALYRGAQILVLDEPTAVLTAQEARELFGVLEALKADGTAIVFISHKLGEVLEIADRVTVLRRGKKVDTVPTEGATEASLARLMVGRDVLLRVDKPAADVRRARCWRSATSRSPTTAACPPCAASTLTVHAGEIVALAGVDGNGQSELVEAITGLRPVQSGTVAIEGRDRTGASARAMVRAGRRRTSPRTASAAAWCSTSRSPRTSRCASTRPSA